MKTKTLIAVGVLGALLAAFFLTREEQVAEGIKSMPPLGLTADQVQRLEVSGEHKAVLEKGQQGWTVAHPDSAALKYPADEALVKSALAALADFKAPDLASERKERHAEYGVDDKGTRVKVTRADGQTVELVWGKPSRRGGAYVRRAESDAVFISPSNLQWQFNRDVLAWREKRLRAPAAGDLARVSVTHPDGHAFTLEAGEGGGWALDGALPRGFRFDAAAAQRLVSAVTSLRAADFLKGEAPDFSRGLRFRLEKKDGGGVTVTFGERRSDGQVPVSLEGESEVATVPGFTFDQVNKRLDDLRARTLFTFDAQKVTRLEVAAGAQRTVVQKREGDWTLVEPKTPPAGVTFTATQVPVVLSRLAALEASRGAFDAAPKATGLSKPTLQVTVTLEDGTTQRLALGADAPDGEVYARGAADELTWRLPVSQKTWLAKGVELFGPPPPPPALGQGHGLEQLPPELRRQLEAQLRLQQP
ncbi:MAG: DUF4340 domain-containing protein [Myxococcota bacterium]